MDELRGRVIGRLRGLFEAREPRWEVVWALMGNGAGVVAVPGQAGKVYCRLLGNIQLTVRAWNQQTPLTNDLRVDVRVIREEGMPTDYFVLGLSRVGYEGYRDEAYWYLTKHGRTHEYDPEGLGSDIVNIYKRALTELRADAQTTPDMTVYVGSGFYLTPDGMQYFVGDNSPTFSAAPTSGERYDLLYVDISTGVLTIREGTVAGSGLAQRPSVEKDEVPICWVLLEAGDTAIVYTMITDARVILATVGAYGSVLAHPLDPMDGVHTGALAGLHVHVWKEDKSGECDDSKTVFITAQQFEPETLCVALNGLEQREGATLDFTEGSMHDSFTMVTAPHVDDSLLVAYVPQQV